MKLELPIYEREWHGIRLADLLVDPAEGKSLAGPAFYDAFYAKLKSLNKPPCPQWEKDKRALGKLMEKEILAPLGKKIGAKPSIFAAACGFGYTEGVWYEEDYPVVFQECQEYSLQKLKERYANARVVCGDIREIDLTEKFDVVTLIGVDYALNVHELESLLMTAKKILTKQGCILLYSPNCLSLRQVLAELTKHALGHYRRNGYIRWGYWRTPSVYHDVVSKVGMMVTREFRNGQERSLHQGLPRLMSLEGNNLVLQLEVV
jgi:SAM-dependent methyltransferase